MQYLVITQRKFLYRGLSTAPRCPKVRKQNIRTRCPKVGKQILGHNVQK